MNVPEVMLASADIKHPPEHFLQDKGRYIVQEKLDGIRALIVHQNRVTRVYGRNTVSSGERAEFTASLPEVVRCFNHISKDFILDVELMSSDFLTLQTKVRTTKKLIDDPRFYVVVFDLLLYEGIDLIGPKISYESRLASLNLFIKNYLEPFYYTPFIRPIETMGVIKKFEDIQSYMLKAVEKGAEGIIVKDTHSAYKPGKRSSEWLKVLPHREMDVTFTGMVEGTGKYVGSMGALNAQILTPEDPISLYVEAHLLRFQVGTGFSDELRNRVWTNFGSGLNYFPISGKIKYKDLYPSGIPRMPVFLQFKEDLV